MKIIDARSGLEMKVGDVVRYPDGEWTELVSARPGVFSAVATFRRRYRDRSRAIWRADGTLDDATPFVEGVLVDQPLIVRWTHPRFFLQHVAFLPS